MKSKISLIILIAVITALISLPLSGLCKQTSKAEKKVVMIIAHKNFRDEELEIPKNIMENKGIKVIVASSSRDYATGMLGATVKPDILINEIKVKDYDAIIFVGGSGANCYWNDPTAHLIAQEAVKKGKILCAICIAPVTLANAGVLKGKRATVWPAVKNKLRAKGAIYTGKNLEVDDGIITASGPQAAQEFGKAIVNALFPQNNSQNKKM